MARLAPHHFPAEKDLFLLIKRLSFEEQQELLALFILDQGKERTVAEALADAQVGDPNHIAGRLVGHSLFHEKLTKGLRRYKGQCSKVAVIR